MDQQIRRSTAEEEQEELDEINEPAYKKLKGGSNVPAKRKADKAAAVAELVGNPVPKGEALQRWGHRYPNKNTKKANDRRKASEDVRDEETEGPVESAAHYLQAVVDNLSYKLGDCVTVNSDGESDYLGRIVEFFKAVDGSLWFSAQWFFRAEDTAIGKDEAKKHDKKRIFYSEVKDDNLLECITGKIKVVQVSPLKNFNKLTKSIPACDYYFDMGYNYSYSTYYDLTTDAGSTCSDDASTICNDTHTTTAHSDQKSDSEASCDRNSVSKYDLSLLDLYAGCGGMSTGLCMGASLAGVNLVTRWAVDLNQNACKSLSHNHPETQVRNEAAEDFLTLLKEWQKLCQKYGGSEDSLDFKAEERSKCSGANDDSKNEEESSEDESETVEPGEYEVEKVIGIRWVGSNEDSKKGLEFKVHWRGYDEDEDSWEPIDGLENCHERIQEFVIEGRKKKILPLPGDVDVICGGPPCQGASGFNRFRNAIAPLDDPRNHQMVIYMDIVDFLKPRFLLMENVVDILKFCGGVLGRYALSRLVSMHYQAKLGLMVAGCYGLAQFRMRVFLWGACPNEKLPPFPLPTHNVVVRGNIPADWERNVVAYDETQHPNLQKALVLGDAISDLPVVENSERRDEMDYQKAPRTDFQRYIRSSKEVLSGRAPLTSKMKKLTLYDHRPLELNIDDYQRTCKIPKKKGANFRDLEGVVIRPDNTVELDQETERVYLSSGKPLVPDYAITFVKGRSLKPFGRLWWDEIVSTVVGRAEPHNQIILHPEQDRVLTIRENARLQGFPDHYKLFGPVKERYVQVGNAVAVPVARAQGYALGLAIQQQCRSGDLVMELPPKFPQSVMSLQSLSPNNNIELPIDVEEQCR
ncbi:hypothetical protein O6H91_16G037000 [Diphasiastrum complanatum]|uniref:Uncharacterized protein n=1 Tax=Diphasiastrum complanatum TaxID=34168 RepID=A0ACC2BBK2_DIPCM|nr:hypothetical protein O6H91_16G037000 [Diphasiastrum complanatum]